MKKQNVGKSLSFKLRDIDKRNLKRYLRYRRQLINMGLRTDIAEIYAHWRAYETKD